MEFDKKYYETDVLVLGSGASGCGAAIAARRAGADVLMVDKGRLESSGNLGGGNDHFMAVLDVDEHDGYEDLADYWATPVTGMTRGVVRNLYESMKPCISILEEAGLEFKHNPDGSYMRSVGFGQPGAWWIHIDHGFTVKPKLAKYIRKMGVKVVDNVQVLALLKDGDRIAGCLGWNVKNGDFVVIRCKTAVLCFGLVSERVSNNSTHKPFNVWYSPYVTGSQQVLALEAGASVNAMETSDMCTMLPKGWGAPGMNGINNMGGKELNAKGERFMGKYDPMMENGLRVHQVMGTYNEMLEGSGPPFVMDMTHFSAEDARHLQYDLMPGDKETYLDYCRARNIDFTKAPLEVEIGERLIGGLVVCSDEQETDVRNLYTSSLLGNFSGAMCLGYSAGRFAAARAAETSMPAIDQAEVDSWFSTLYEPLIRPCERPVSYTTFEDGLRQVMDYYVGFQRSEGSMLRALESMKVLEEYLPRLGASDFRELMRVHESRELFKLCRVYIQACLQRKESGRTMYRRADYPDLDPSLNRPLTTSLAADGSVEFTWK